jgi:hypothetical protein
LFFKWQLAENNILNRWSGLSDAIHLQVSQLQEHQMKWTSYEQQFDKLVDFVTEVENQFRKPLQSTSKEPAEVSNVLNSFQFRN